MNKNLMNMGQYNNRHFIKHVALKFKNGTFTIKLEYLTVLNIFRTS